MPTPSILDDILKQLKAQKRNGPFPDHIAAQAGIVVNYAGKVMDQALESKYEKELRTQEVYKSMIKSELVRTAAACIRMMENL